MTQIATELRACPVCGSAERTLAVTAPGEWLDKDHPVPLVDYAYYRCQACESVTLPRHAGIPFGRPWRMLSWTVRTIRVGMPSSRAGATASNVRSTASPCARAARRRTGPAPPLREPRG